MPKGSSPKERMSQRRAMLQRQESRLSGSDLYDRGIDKLAPDANIFQRGAAKAAGMLGDIRRDQLERGNPQRLKKLRSDLDKIDMNRDTASEYTSEAKRFRDGGMVKGCKSGQASGKGFRGTF